MSTTMSDCRISSVLKLCHRCRTASFHALADPRVTLPRAWLRESRAGNYHLHSASEGRKSSSRGHTPRTATGRRIGGYRDSGWDREPLAARVKSHAGGVTRPWTDGVLPSRFRKAAPRSARSRAEAARNPLGDGHLRSSALSFVGGDHPDRHPPHSAPSDRRSPPRLPRDF